MTNFVEIPNLPKGKVKTVVCGEMNAEMMKYFYREGINVILAKANKKIEASVRNHIDLSAIHIKKEKIIVEKSQKELIDNLRATGMEVTESESMVSGNYPNDIKLNFAVVGTKIFGKLADMDKALFDSTKDFERINVNQGYAKCSVCVVNTNAIITDDVSIDSVARQKGIDSLLISKGDVNLSGHDYGFIGGACGKISENQILFFGNIKAHRDFRKIEEFLKFYSCKIISLDNFPLTDFGGIIPVIEEKNIAY